MKNKKKYLLILVVIGVILFTVGVVLIAVRFINTSSGTDEDAVTRFEWMEMLGEQFGLTEYSSTSPYFKDVDLDNPYFCYVQSAVEWGVIDKEDNFNGDKAATGEFIALTTMRAMGKYKIQIYLETDRELDTSDYLDLAYANTLIEVDQSDLKFDMEECLAVLERAQRLNDQVLWKDDVAVVKYQEDVIELEPENISSYQEETGEVLVETSVLEELSVGDIIIFDTGSMGLKTAGRIETVDPSGTVTVSQPSMEEVLDSLIISDITSFSGGDIANYYHMGNTSFTAYENALSSWGNSAGFRVMPLYTVDKTIDNKGMAFSISSEDGKVKIKVTDKNTDLSLESTLELGLDEDTDIECSFEITNIAVGVQMDWNWSSLRYADIQLYAELVEKVNFSIVSDDVEIPLGEITIPLVGGLASVDLQLCLVISAEGEISLETKIPVGAHLYYEKGRELRSIQMNLSYPQPQFEISAKLELMLQPRATLKVLMFWEAAEINLSAGVSAAAKTSVYPMQQECTDVSIAFPVIKLGASVDPVVTEPLSVEWEIISEDDAPFKWSLHYEQYMNGGAGFVDECTYGKQAGTPLEESSGPEDIQEEVFSNGATEFVKYHTYELPIELRITSPFEDSGEYYTVRGELNIDYTVDASEFDALQEGDTFAMQDKRFVKGRMLADDDYPDYVYLGEPLPQIYPVYCVEDDTTYYIDATIGLDWGSRYGSEYYLLLYDNPVLVAGSYEGVAAWRTVGNDVGEFEFKIAKDAYISSVAEQELYTAEDCFNNHIAIGFDGYDLPTLSVWGSVRDGIDCYVTFDANGVINSIVIQEIN